MKLMLLAWFAVALTVACDYDKDSSKEPADETQTKCPAGQHKSGDQCCDTGHEWVPAKKACVCMDAAQCGPAPAAAPAAPPPAAKAPLCRGTFAGKIKGKSGYSAKITVEVSEPTLPNIDDPKGGWCGRISENWGANGTCKARLRDCTQTGDTLIAVARPSGSLQDCDRSRIQLDCTEAGADYKRKEKGYWAKGALTRSEAATP